MIFNLTNLVFTEGLFYTYSYTKLNQVVLKTNNKSKIICNISEIVTTMLLHLVKLYLILNVS